MSYGNILGYGARQYAFGTPETDLKFAYSEQEIAEIRLGTLPDSAAARLSDRANHIAPRMLKLEVVQFLCFASFAGIAFVVAPDREAPATVWFPVGVMVLWALLAGTVGLVQWSRFHRPVQSRALKMQTLRAFPRSHPPRTFQVTFGHIEHDPKTPLWKLDKVGYQLLHDGAFYRVYWVADILVYLEEFE